MRHQRWVRGVPRSSVESGTNVPARQRRPPTRPPTQNPLLLMLHFGRVPCKLLRWLRRRRLQREQAGRACCHIVWPRVPEASAFLQDATRAARLLSPGRTALTTVHMFCRQCLDCLSLIYTLRAAVGGFPTVRNKPEERRRHFVQEAEL